MTTSTYIADISDLPDVSACTTHHEILAAMRLYEARESSLDAALDQLIADRQELDSLLDKMDTLGPVVDSVQMDARELAIRIDNTAQVAERISGQVRKLDEEQVRCALLCEAPLWLTCDLV